MPKASAKPLQQAPEEVAIPGRPTPLHDSDESSLLAVLCLLFQIRRRAARMLIMLLTQGYVGKEELIAAASRDEQPTTIGSANMLLSMLRQRLALHEIQVVTIPGLGYAIDGAGRNKVRRMLTTHSRRIMTLAQAEG